jgi:lipopolysaccharide transport system permease protein
MASCETRSSERRSATVETACPPADTQSEASRMLQISNWKKILVLEEPSLVVIKPGQIPVSRTIFELWEHRELIKNLVWRDLTTRYRQTILGAGWAVLQPLGFMLVITLFVKHPSHPGSGSVPYSVLVYSSLIVWQYFNASVTRASDSVLSMGALMKKVYFPRLAAPIGSVMPAMVDFAITFMLLMAMVLWFHLPISICVLAAPLFVFLAATLALGIGLWVSALHVRYRDMFQLVPFLLQMLFFASPIIYSSDSIPDALRPVYQLNPLVGVIEGFRWSVLGTHAPTSGLVLYSIVVSIILLVSGFLFFRRTERTFVDYV